MPGGRPPVALEEHRDFITTSIQVVGLSLGEVRDELLTSHGLKIGRSTFRKHLSKWGLRSRRQNFSDSPALRMRLQHFFHQTRLTDAEISTTLTDNEGIDITPVRVAKCRKEMGLYKRVDADKKLVAEATIEDLLRKELDENDAVRDMGQRALYEHMRAKYNVAGRDRIFEIAKKLDPEGPWRRLRAQRADARKNGLRKERAAKEDKMSQQQQQQEGEASQTEQQRVEQQPVEQQALPQYVPLDPAMYYADYPPHSQRHEMTDGVATHDQGQETSYPDQREVRQDPAAQPQGYYPTPRDQTTYAPSEMHGYHAQHPTGRTET